MITALPNHRPALDAAAALCLHSIGIRRASEAGRYANSLGLP